MNRPYLHLARWMLAPGLAIILVFVLLAAALEHASASTTEREGIDEVAASLIDDAAMEQLAETLQDADASAACRGYADLLLLYAAYVRHMLVFPESRVALSEFTGRVAASLPANQYACENAI